MPRHNGQQPGAEGVQFQFMQITHPAGKLTDEHRKRVCSHVTKLQHRRHDAARRRSSPTPKTTDRSTSEKDEEVTAGPVSGPSHSAPAKQNSSALVPAQPDSRVTGSSALVSSREDSQVSISSSTPELKHRDSHASTSSTLVSPDENRQILKSAASTPDRADRRSPDTPPFLSSSTKAWKTSEYRTPPISTWTKAAKFFSTGSMSFQVFYVHDVDNVIGQSLKTLKLDAAAIVDYYGAMIRFLSRDFDAQFQIASKDKLWKKYVSMLFEEPSMLLAAIIVTIRHRSFRDQRTFTPEEWRSLLRMERHLIFTMNEAIVDKRRSIADPMIIAVTICASYEIFFGTPAAFHAHMRGMMQMIRLRGGLETMMEEDESTVKYLIWNDMNSAAMMQCEPYLKLPSEKSMAPNSKHFSLRGSDTPQRLQ